MAAEQRIKLGRYTALASLIIGTGIFGLYAYTSSFDVAMFGMLFIVIATLANLSALLGVLTVREDIHGPQRRFAAALILLNIPVMLLYLWLAGILMNTIRVTFINNKKTAVTDINITGCETIHIDMLAGLHYKTVWIDIPSDCEIYIDYLQDSQRKKETVAGYVTNNMGAKVSYEIGSGQEAIW